MFMFMCLKNRNYTNLEVKKIGNKQIKVIFEFFSDDH